MVYIPTYRGLDAKTLQNLTIEECLPLLKSRARRAVKRALKGVNVQLKKLIQKVEKYKRLKIQKPIRTHIREAPILPNWIGLKFAVHNGKEFKPVEITIDKIGYRLGDFAYTTGRVIHAGPGIGATRGSKYIPLK
ncbi:MAG: ribosomal protein S19 family protein [Candidatus Micrarchaeota archaeon]|nr:ribosomal protein S19 family protein [Candidatus Micrarchaeota archaeon]